MTNRDKTVLIEGFRKLSRDAADIAAALEEKPAQAGTQDTPAGNTVPEPEKAYTYEEVRAILAEKSRTGFRAEVKALLTAHGLKQLSLVVKPRGKPVLAPEDDRRPEFNTAINDFEEENNHE